MSIIADIKVLSHLVFNRSRGASHKERLESFYGGQATGYDQFRRRLLKGREELAGLLDVPEGTVWADIGGGTGANLEFYGDKIKQFKKIYLVDLAQPLLDVAQQRIERHGWTNVETVCADATSWQPPEGTIDRVTFSYSLTMIPDWFAAIDNAYAILSVGGTIGVVDFYIARKYPLPEQVKHGWLTRSFWPVWFGCDNVFPGVDHLPYLQRRFQQEQLRECKNRIPYFPLFWWKMPYYIFTGKKIS